MCDSIDYDVILTLTLSFKKEKKIKKNENEILNEKTSVQALHV